MKQKEKAIELVDRMIIHASPYHSTIKENAKQCAIIAVDEIIAVTHEDPYPRPKTKMDKEYWQGVKEEIEKL